MASLVVGAYVNTRKYVRSQSCKQALKSISSIAFEFNDLQPVILLAKTVAIM